MVPEPEKALHDTLGAFLRATKEATAAQDKDETLRAAIARLETLNPHKPKPMSFDFIGVEVRQLWIEGEPWFVAVDVCKCLGLDNVTNALKGLDEDEFLQVSATLISSKGQAGKGAQTFNVVNEPGLWGLVLKSKKPAAKVFKRWLKHEVIPSIRKNGTYVEGLPSSFGHALLLAGLERLRSENLESEVLALKGPAENYADIATEASSSFGVREAAKIISSKGYPTKQGELIQWLIEHGWLYRNANTKSGKLTAYAHMVERGYVAEFRRPGQKQVYAQARITNAGIQKIVRIKKRQMEAS